MVVRAVLRAVTVLLMVKLAVLLTLTATCATVTGAKHAAQNQAHLTVLMKVVHLKCLK